MKLLTDEPTLPDIHSERDFGKLLRFDLLPYADLLAYFRVRRTVLLRILTSLTLQQWSRTSSEIGKQRKETIYWRAHSLAMHELEHLSEIERRLNEL